MTNTDLAAKATYVYINNIDWTYCQGAIGHLAESDRVRGLYNWFWSQPNHAGNSMTVPYSEWLPQNEGKKCTDCSNFINYLLGYTYSHYSTNGLSKQKRFEGDIKDAPIGTILCMNGHVGIVVGHNKFVDFYKYNETCRMGDIDKSLFEYAIYLPEIDYTGSVATRIYAEVKEDIHHYVGDDVSKNDFIVTYVDDKGKRGITTEFMFSPLKYTNTINTIAIVYADLITYVVVGADSKGELYVIQIPCDDLEDAFKKQKALVLAGYEGTSILQV